MIVSLMLAGCSAPQQTSPPRPATASASPLVAACEAGTANSCLIAASDAEQAADLDTAGRLYLKACELGESAGCALAGGVFSTAGQLEAGRAAFAAGCALDDGTSCYGQGLSAAGGFGGEPDWGSAVAPYEKACTLGLPSGCGELANLVAAGRGTEVDLERAHTLRKSACDQGDGESCTRLGLEAWRIKDLPVARVLFETACVAKLSDPNGCGYFGWLLWSDDTASDPAKGVAMLDASCAAASAIGCALRANVHARLGDLESGKAALRQACELDPDNCETMSAQFEAASKPQAGP